MVHPAVAFNRETFQTMGSGRCSFIQGVELGDLPILNNNSVAVGPNRSSRAAEAAEIRETVL